MYLKSTLTFETYYMWTCMDRHRSSNYYREGCRTNWLNDSLASESSEQKETHPNPQFISVKHPDTSGALSK